MATNLKSLREPILRPPILICTALILLLILSGGNSVADQGVQNSGLAPTRALAPVLLVDGGDTAEADSWYHAFMDSTFGPGNWDLYDMPSQGLPNPPELFQGVLGQYQGVLWHVSDSQGFFDLSLASDFLAEYVQPEVPGSSAGRLVLVAPNLFGTMFDVSYRLSEEGLGLHRESAPPGSFTIPATKTAFTYFPYLGDLVAPVDVIGASGLQPMVGSEILYQMEYCTCYSRRPPYEPIVGVRNPDRQTSTYARSVTISLPLHQYGKPGQDTLGLILKYHLGIVPTTESGSGAGNVRMAINNAGYFGNFFQSPDRPSLVYPYPGFAEHLYQGGIWVGARKPGGELRVSTSSDHYGSSVEGNELREFVPDEGGMVVTSNIPGSPFYDPNALAPWQLECAFNDQAQANSHSPLGLKVILKAMAWNDHPIDDGVVLEYRVVNESGSELRDVYFGLFNDTTVGNTQFRSPYYPYVPGQLMWSYNDDLNGGWRPGDIPGDPDIWMMWEHDEDGDEGWATSWVGCRLLGSNHDMTPPPGQPPVSYNAWPFRDGPEEDGFYIDFGTGLTIPGRYQAMSNGAFASGVTENVDYSLPDNWLGLLATGPVASLADGDTLRVTYAMVCGKSEWDLLRNSYKFAELEANGWNLDVSAVLQMGESGVQLFPVAPNPFNAHTEISFRLDQSQWTTLDIFSPDGRRVATLLDEFKNAGEHRINWDGRDDSGRAMASGLYLHRLTTEGGGSHIGHMTLVK